VADSLPALQELIARVWGYASLRPLQEQAMRAVLDRRDSLVVLPTGGGKSLCYQAPAVYRGGTTVVVSPLIALMKDQVDGLVHCGVAAARLDSTLSPKERREVDTNLRGGALRLLFVSPERLVNSELPAILEDLGVQTLAVDEAHCISHWGHDFRPEYRQLRALRERLPDASFHAYTATATEQVRHDIISQLGLHEPDVLVGNFDRPNLVYRVLPQNEVTKQVLEVLDRHKDEAGIIYCLRQRDVDELCEKLQKRGLKAVPYHAGLSNGDRDTAQEAFLREECDVVVATIAFGMGIDRSNVRFVLHVAMPKSLEHYQQETGRAGRDGLEAECVLLYSARDHLTLKAIVKASAERAAAEGTPVAPDYLTSSYKHLEEMSRYCRGAVCRHKALVRYFGQDHAKENCEACDLCLGDTEEVPEANVVAQKILSCVARVKERFGVGHVINVLRGKSGDMVVKYQHEQLTTFGLLKETPDVNLRDWIFQLIDQGVLIQTEEEYPKLRLNPGSWEVMKGQRAVRLIQIRRRAKGEARKATRTEEVSWEGVDRLLFDRLRDLRRRLAQEQAVPSYVIFADRTLREMARVRPSSPTGLLRITGVGQKKLSDYGDAFLEVIRQNSRDRGLPMDVE
jgi:ATP-dependent DNA helicase RecQ